MNDDSIRSESFSESTKQSRTEESITDGTATLFDHELVTVIRPGDVLFGRGRPFQMHPGNKRMHEMADKYKVQYAKMRSIDKRKITLAIVKCIQNEFNGRFLRPTEAPQSKDENMPPMAYWKIVTDLEAQHKVRHTIRSRLRDDELKEASSSPTKLKIDDDFKIEYKPSPSSKESRLGCNSGAFFAEQMMRKADPHRSKEKNSKADGSPKAPHKAKRRIAKMSLGNARMSTNRMTQKNIEIKHPTVLQSKKASQVEVTDGREIEILERQAVLSRRNSYNSIGNLVDQEESLQPEPRLMSEPTSMYWRESVLAPRTRSIQLSDSVTPRRFSSNGLPPLDSPSQILGALLELPAQHRPSRPFEVPNRLPPFSLSKAPFVPTLPMTNEERALRVRLAEINAQREAIAALTFARGSMLG